MKSLFITFITLLSCANLSAQVDSVKLQMRIDSIRDNEAKWLHRQMGSPYEYPPVITESTISLVPEIQAGRNFYLALYDFTWSMNFTPLKNY